MSHLPEVHQQVIAHVWFYKFRQEPFAREVLGCRGKSFTTDILNSPFATVFSKTFAYTHRPVLC